MENNKFTPALIAESTLIFSIPLYQRLFEWRTEQVEQLLNDLYEAYQKDIESPYYIGMLTAYKNKSTGFIELVDGQQRFTVLMLLGIFYGWKDFVKYGEGLRLQFFARENDRNYLKSKIDGSTCAYTNRKMEKALEAIGVFMQNKVDIQDTFKKYIFEKLTFFVAELPDTYQSSDLNTYFEAMNATGRGLENHEILKVALLKKLPSNTDQILYTQIWNSVSDMDKPLIRQRISAKESTNDFIIRQQETLKLLDNGDIARLYKSCNDSNKANDEVNQFSRKTIRSVDELDKKPSIQIRSIGERSIITFSQFLLYVLRLQIDADNKGIKDNFFNEYKLLDTFDYYFSRTNEENLEEKTKLFFDNLLKYRLLFDYYIIRVVNSESNISDYTLNYRYEDDADFRKKYMQYQSMMYVSTETQRWLVELLQYVHLHKQEIPIKNLYDQLILIDNKLRTNEPLELNYDKKVQRYWFWKLDYLLWEQALDRKSYDDSYSRAILNYIFKPNRSIEHLHPQTSADRWSDAALHGFGNLAMISSSFNSTQSNDDVKVKFARIETQIDGKHQLESVKLLEMYKLAKEKNNGQWSPELASIHGEAMIKILTKKNDDL